jgi:hypothetical protein
LANLERTEHVVFVPAAIVWRCNADLDWKAAVDPDLVCALRLGFPSYQRAIFLLGPVRYAPMLSPFGVRADFLGWEGKDQAQTVNGFSGRVSTHPSAEFSG